jgi:hypothetical protein
LDLSAIHDGEGGIIAAWCGDVGDGVVAQRIDALGSLVWDAAGVVVCDAAAGDQEAVTMATDGAGGAILSWEDRRNGPTQIYAQRLLGNGLIGSFLADIAYIVDLPDDEGGWARGILDAAPADPGLHSPGVTGYNVWRRIQAEPRTQASAIRHDTLGGSKHPARAPRPDAQAITLLKRATHEPVRLDPAQAAAAGFPPGTWESVGFHAATQGSSYVLVVPTRMDSTEQNPSFEVYVVTVHTTVPWQYTVTDTAWGYSKDNLAPAMPAPFTGQYSAGAAALHWNPNAESDLTGYRLHCGTSPGFAPEPGNLVAALTDTGFVHAAGQPLHYKLCAVDVHGNESPYAALLPTGALAAEGGAPAGLALAAGPNPARGSVTLRCALPITCPVRLAVFDPAGRRVRVLAEGELPAGEHRFAWDVGDEHGHPLGPGLYVVRLEAMGRAMTRRLVTLK